MSVTINFGLFYFCKTQGFCVLVVIIVVILRGKKLLSPTAKHQKSGAFVLTEQS